MRRATSISNMARSLMVDHENKKKPVKEIKGPESFFSKEAFPKVKTGQLPKANCQINQDHSKTKSVALGLQNQKFKLPDMNSSRNLNTSSSQAVISNRSLNKSSSSIFTKTGLPSSDRNNFSFSQLMKMIKNGSLAFDSVDKLSEFIKDQGVSKFPGMVGKLANALNLTSFEDLSKLARLNGYYSPPYKLGELARGAGVGSFPGILGKLAASAEFRSHEQLHEFIQAAGIEGTKLLEHLLAEYPEGVQQRIFDAYDNINYSGTLNLSYCGLNKIPDKLVFLFLKEPLQHLDLSHNYIMKIEHLENLNTLATLDLSYNEIPKFGGLENCQQLKEFSLSNNQIKMIENLGNCQKLTKLDLSNNQIQKIEGLENCERLESLHLRFNLIRAFDGVRRCRSLNEVDLSNNKICSIDNRVLADFMLKKLDISGNAVKISLEALNPILRDVVKSLWNLGVASLRNDDRLFEIDKELLIQSYINCDFDAHSEADLGMPASLHEAQDKLLLQIEAYCLALFKLNQLDNSEVIAKLGKRFVSNQLDPQQTVGLRINQFNS